MQTEYIESGYSKNIGRESRVRAEGLVKPAACIHIEITQDDTRNFIIYSTPSPGQQRQVQTQLPGPLLYTSYTAC